MQSSINDSLNTFYWVAFNTFKTFRIEFIFGYKLYFQEITLKFFI